jgi:hypothetical protein
MYKLPVVVQLICAKEVLLHLQFVIYVPNLIS